MQRRQIFVLPERFRQLWRLGLGAVKRRRLFAGLLCPQFVLLFDQRGDTHLLRWNGWSDGAASADQAGEHDGEATQT